MDDSMKEYYDFFKKILLRPGMYVGKAKLDYIQTYFSGWLHGREVKAYWNSDYDLQKWLFYNSSASINHAASIHGWNLLYRCFGAKQAGIDALKKIVNEIPFSNCDEFSIHDTVSHHVFSVYAYLKHGELRRAVEYPPFNAEVSSHFYPKLSESILKKIPVINKGYENIVSIVDEMINEPYDDLWIYMHCESYFLQIRFLYLNKKNMWVDSISLSNQAEYYNYLVTLHGCASFVEKEVPESHIVTINSKNGCIKTHIEQFEGQEGNFFNQNSFDVSQIDDDCTFNKKFDSWKKSIVNP